MHKLIPFFNLRANFPLYEVLPLANRSLFPSESNGKLIFVFQLFALRAVLEEQIKLVNRGINVFIYLFIYLFIYVFVCLYLENGCTDLHQTWHAYSLRPGREHMRVKTPEKCPEFDSR
jgi:hypothetical protein